MQKEKRKKRKSENHTKNNNETGNRETRKTEQERNLVYILYKKNYFKFYERSCPK